MHGKPLKNCNLVDLPSDMILLDVDEPMYAVAPGQVRKICPLGSYWLVFFLNKLCLTPPT